MEKRSDIQDSPIGEIKGFFYERQVFEKERLGELARDIRAKSVLQNVVIAKKLVSDDGEKVMGENMVPTQKTWNTIVSFFCEVYEDPGW